LDAQKAGLKKNDVIVELASVPQVKSTDYLHAIEGKVAGDVVTVVLSIAEKRGKMWT